MCDPPETGTIRHWLQGTNSSNEQECFATGGDGPTDPTPTRQGRSKYASRACEQCQRRKIKCDNGPRCNQCLLSGRSCSRQNVDLRGRAKRRRLMPPDEPPNDRGEGSSRSEYDRTTVVRLEERVAQLERILDRILGLRTAADNESSGSTTSYDASYIVESRSSRPASRPPTYSGETSISSNLAQVEAYLEEQPYTAPDQPYEMATPALTPAPPITAPAPPRGVSTLCKALHDHDIVIDKQQWDHFMTIFCDEVHILYPVLNLRNLWGQYDLLWKDHITSPSAFEQLDRESRISLSQILICLAIGRCTASPRIAGQGGRHSAGWSLYCAALELFGDLLDCFEECSNQLLILQTLGLMVIYLFRLDIVSKAEKVLALVISHAYYLGLHRSQADMHSMDPSVTEVSRRVWWSLYILDRRLAIEGGHPVLISDRDVNMPLPRLSDEEDIIVAESESTCHPSFQPETSSRPSPILYLIAMAEYSRVLGKVWEAVYSAGTGSNPSPALCEHLEALLFGVQSQIPSIFRYHPDAEPSPRPATAPWWLTKQQSLMQIRWLSLRVLIRKPMLQKSVSGTTSDLSSLENEAICLRIMNNVIEEAMELPAEQALFTFPFFHDLLRAVLISLGVLIKQPAFKEQYAVAVVRGVRLLEAYGQKTWVSGKLIRTVAKLSRIISRVFGAIDHRLAHSSQPRGPYNKESGAVSRFRSIDGLRWSNLSSSTTPSEQSQRQQQQDSSIMPRNEAHSSEADIGFSDTDFSSLASPLMTDFDFEQGILCPTAPEIRTSASNGSSPVRATKRRELSVVEDFDWLYALFGDYLDPALIVFQ